MEQVLFECHKNHTEMQVRRTHGWHRDSSNTVYGRARFEADGIWHRECYACGAVNQRYSVWALTPLVTDQRSAGDNIVNHQLLVHLQPLRRIRKWNPLRTY